MSSPYINVYKNNPTSGGTDGTAVSTDGIFTAPISFVLDASQNESQIQKLAIRTEEGYVTSGTTTITDNNDTNDRLKLSWTENGTFADSISTANSISSVNTIFYAQASSANTENPQTDRSASFKVDCVIASV
ncbi:MAG: hypothetical protein IJQ01_06490 [Selenomonadaceae bacterium]|nr:hypothetical protein [Selenomonadaceae bacterium]